MVKITIWDEVGSIKFIVVRIMERTKTEILIHMFISIVSL